MNKNMIGRIVGGIAASVLLVAAPLANAHDRVNWSVNIGVPAASYPVYASPVYAPPAVVYQSPQPVYYESRPSYYPAPVMYPARALYVAPAPVYYGGYYQRPRHWDHGRQGHRHEGLYER